MESYTISFTTMGSMKTFEMTVEAESYKQAAETFCSQNRNRKIPSKIWKGKPDSKSSLTNAVAEELLMEMDANQSDSVKLGEQEYTRSDVEAALFAKSSSEKFRFTKALNGNLD